MAHVQSINRELRVHRTEAVRAVSPLGLACRHLGSFILTFGGSIEAMRIGKFFFCSCCAAMRPF
jgi:hypothetical protein